MFQIKTSELKSVIKRLRAAHKPLLLIGTYGIGKSEMIFVITFFFQKISVSNFKNSIQISFLKRLFECSFLEACTKYKVSFVIS